MIGVLIIVFFYFYSRPIPWASRSHGILVPWATTCRPFREPCPSLRMHVVDLFQDHCESSVYRLCPKLTRQHVDLTAFWAMKVNLAAQVFSKTVGKALSYAYGDSVRESAKFVMTMNRWFDLMNTKSLYEGIHKRNEDLYPFSDPNDERLQWLENGFIQYFEEWEHSVANRRGPYLELSLQPVPLLLALDSCCPKVLSLC